MSTQTYFRATAITALSALAFAAMASTANAQSRYADVYDYERGQNCGQACVPAAPVATTSSRYGSTVTTAPAMQVAPGPVYVDCTQLGTCAPQAATVYTAPVQQYQAPAPTYSTQSYTQTSTYSAAPVNCPAGTTAQPDGTCLQGSMGSVGSTTSSSMTVTLPTNYGTTESVPCPAGTTKQPDGTCMQGGGSSSWSSSSTTSSYGSSNSYSTSTYSAAPVNCPAGTTAQPDGTCMQGGSGSYTNSTVEIYTGDAQTTGPVYGYQNTGSYTASDYLPIRK